MRGYCPKRAAVGLTGALAGSVLLLLAACTTNAGNAASLRLEDRPIENYVRVLNESGRDATFYYNLGNFGPEPWLFIRYRDGAGRIVGRLDGWWAPAMTSSQLYGPDEFPKRDKLKVRANGFVDLPRDIPALQYWRSGADRAEGPCSMQLKLLLYPARRTWRRVEPMTEWRPAPCPAPDARPAPPA
jgi:hypothetical protein